MSNPSAKKTVASVLALATALTTLSAFPETAAPVFAEDVKYEFEDGTIEGTSTTVMSEEKGFSGTGYVYMKDAGDIISIEADIPETGMYEVYISYYLPAAVGDSKIQNILINGVNQGQAGFTANETFTETCIGTYKLNKGKNTIGLQSSWGWTMFDYVSVKSAELPQLVGSNKLCDENATDSTQRLMSYLADVYGKHIISGQQEIYKYGPHDFDYEFNYIKETTGKLPAIRGFDYLNTNPLYGSEDGTTDRIIEWTNTSKGIATTSWHITVPKQFENYKIGDKVDWAQATYVPGDTDFDTAKAVVEGTKEYEYYMLCLDGLAKELKKLQDADVPLIFRPLHEAEGGGGETGSWFWWGKAGSDVYKKLWVLTYKTLTEKYDLHNLIWEWNSYTYESSTNWYPGDEYVDIVAYDKYNCTDWSTGSPVLGHNDSAISGTFYSLVKQYGGKKMVAMAENDSIPTLNNLLEEKAGWLYFCPWYDGGAADTNFLSNPVFNKAEDLAEIYKSDYCITLDELPDLKKYESGNSTVTDPGETSETTKKEISTSNAVIVEKTASTLIVNVEEFDSEGTEINIPADQLDYIKELNISDTIIIGYYDDIKNPEWIDLLKRGDETVVTSESTETSESNTEDTSATETSISDSETTAGSDTSDTTTGNTDVVRGDANCDGIVDIKDVALLAQYIIKMKSLSEQGLINADVVGTDNTVDIKDLAQIKRLLLGDIEKL